MGEARQEQMEAIQQQIKVLNLEGGFEKRMIEALWSQWEKLNLLEMKEAVTRGN